MPGDPTVRLCNGPMQWFLSCLDGVKAHGGYTIREGERMDAIRAECVALMEICGTLPAPPSEVQTIVRSGTERSGNLFPNLFLLVRLCITLHSDVKCKVAFL